MSILRTIIAVLLILTGAVWILQGINILPGSFMTGDMRWAAAGVGSIIIGSVLFFWPRKPTEEG